jgi:hypothetical protein
MKRLITMAQGVIEAQVIHFWYENLETKFKQRMWDVTLLQINQPTLAYVFLLTKRIELNMVGKKNGYVLVSRTNNTPLIISTTNPTWTIE